MAKHRRHKKNKNNKKHTTMIFILLAILLVGGALYMHFRDDKDEKTSQKSDGAKEEIHIQTEDEKPSVTEEDTQSEQPDIDPQPSKGKTAQGILDAMTLEEKIYQMFIVTQEQITGVSTVTQSGETTKNAILKYPVGGIIYFSKNIVNPTQCKSMIQGIQSYSKTPLFIAVDEEGGTVARIANNSAMGTTKFPNMAYIQTTDEAYRVGKTIGTEIGQLGFNLDFAPVADVNSNPNNPVIGERSFSSDPNVVADMVSAAVKGFDDSNMICSLKHFPGHGDTVTDSHLGYTEVTKTQQELESLEFIPFKAGAKAGADMVMVGHLSVPKVTGNDTPATLSSTMIGLLKNDVGFKGIIITDAMNMKAITDRYTSAQAATTAIQAGVDIILMPYNLSEAVGGVVQAVQNGTISESRINESVLKILQTKIDRGIIQ